jgi:copper chaperone CopZ
MSHDHDHAHATVHNAINLKVGGMTCGDCEARLVSAVQALNAPVHDIKASFATGELTMCCDSPDPSAVLQAVHGAIHSVGFQCIGTGGEHGHAHSH